MKKTSYKLLIGTLLMFLVGCEVDDKDLKPATFPNDPNVFIDSFSPGLNYAAFGGSDPKAFVVDKQVKYEGTASMRFAIPDEGSAEGAYAGGVFFAEPARDLSEYDCLTFWAKATQPASIDVIGFGNDLGANKYEASITGLDVNTNWKQYYIPIPDPSKLTKEKGMLFYSTGAIEGNGYTFWLDEVKFEKLGTITSVSPSIMNGKDVSIETFSGQSHTVIGTSGTFSLPNGTIQEVNMTKDYFTFVSSDPTVAIVSALGIVSIVGPGDAVITAKLGDTKAKGSLIIKATGSFIHAPTPTQNADDVISLFSDTYTNVPVDFYNGYWKPYQTTTSADFVVDGDHILAYNNFNFVGIQFTNPTVNASQMTNLHLDIFVPSGTDAQSLKITIKDFGNDGVEGSDDDKSFNRTLSSSQLVAGKWNSIDLSIVGENKSHLGQIVLEEGIGLTSFFLDNIYFYKGEQQDLEAPTQAAPTPTHDADKVISIFSNTYTNIPIDTYRTDWSAGDFQIVTIDGKEMLKYFNMDYVGIEALNPIVDASKMTHLHVDVWSPNFDDFLIKLVDFGVSGAGEVSNGVMNYPTPEKSKWISYDIQLSDFQGLGSAEYLAQFLFSGTPTGQMTIYIDNFYFYDNGTGGGNDTEPTTAAPTPTQNAADVISIFSNTYTDVPVTTYRTDWSNAIFENITIAGIPTIKYSNLDFVGIETTTPTVDASNMTHFHIDVWSSDFTKFSVKLVDFGNDGAFGGGDDVEHQIDFISPLKSGWISYNIPLSAFAGLTTRAHIAQYILVAQPSGSSTVYIENMYFYDDGNGGNTGGNTNTAPTTAAPTPPARNSTDVKSIFSSTYANINIDTYITDWSAANHEVVTIAGKPVLKYYNLDYVGIEAQNPRVDISNMTHVHVDVWSPNFSNFLIKLVDLGVSGSAELSNGVVNYPSPLQSQWISYDIPLSEFVGLNQSGRLAQFLFSGTPTNNMILYVDNFYFYKK